MERKRKRNRNKNDANGPTKEELEIAKHIRFKTPNKSTQINKEDVSYFTGSKAIDTIMASKWATGKTKSKEVLFPTRESAVDFMNLLLENQFFYRAMKNIPEKDKKKDKNNPEDTKVSNIKQPSASEGSPKTVRQRKKNKNEDEDKNKDKDKNKKSKPKEKTKVKKRYKLTEHHDQVFFDSNDIYIWIFSPTHPKTIVMGILLLCGVIGATLFPLWPPEVRTGVYYLSLTGACCIGSIFVIALLRSILFGIIWLCTMGNIHLWILPNILADVGFFDSFKPWYTYENRKEMALEESKKEDDEKGETDKNNEKESNDTDTPQVTNNEEESTQNSAAESDSVVQTSS